MPDTYGKYIRGGVNFSHDTAESISYDNTDSGLTATDTQAAIDELASGAGGHVIVDDGDTELIQRAKLKFEGVYSSDNATDEETNVAVVREMTEAEYALLTDDEKKGIILTENDRNPSLLTGDMIGYDNTTSGLAATDVQTAIDELAGVTIKRYRLTHTGFTWSDGNGCFVSNETLTNIIGDELFFGISGDFTNGAAILGWRVIAQGNIQVMGWIPKNGTNIDSTYQFELFILTKPST